MVGSIAVLILRVVIVLCLTFSAFVGYVVARTYGIDTVSETSPWILVRAVAVSLVLMVLVCWIALIWQLPMVLRSSRQTHRWRGGRCGACGYPRLQEGEDTCSECGEVLQQPVHLQPTLRWLTRSLLLVVVCWLIGVGAGEAQVRMDEAEGRRALQQSKIMDSHVVSIPWTRMWPGRGTIMIIDEE